MRPLLRSSSAAALSRSSSRRSFSHLSRSSCAAAPISRLPPSICLFPLLPGPWMGPCCHSPSESTAAAAAGPLPNQPPPPLTRRRSAPLCTSHRRPSCQEMVRQPLLDLLLPSRSSPLPPFIPGYFSLILARRRRTPRLFFRPDD